MATTRIIPMHLNKGKSIKQCLSERLDYGKNPDKTENGTFISSYACEPDTADADFALSKREYFQLTGRKQESDVIAYQVRQSFKPGEITPEEANRIGYEFAERFLKGNHAFIVCTHTDKHHIHNHIYWNSTTLDCTRKFKNFWGSTMAVRRLSDLICVQHRMSVIENPRPHGMSYNRWQGDIEKLSNRDRLCFDIDEALAKKPHDFEGFLSLMEQAGYIDMRLREGETIFDKMGVSYDALRKMDNPIAPVAKYYRSQLKPGESLWWADTENVADESAPPTVRLWTALPSDMKEILTVQGYALFPEVLRSGSPKKYNRYALWLVTKKGIVNTNIRDSFSAGGKVPMRTIEGIDVMMPAAFGRIKKYHELIEDLLEEISEETLKEYWETDVINEDRLTQWCCMVSSAATTDPNIDYTLAWKVLAGIFPGLGKKREILEEKKKIYVYDKQNGSTLKVAEERTLYEKAKPKVIETPFASIQVGDQVKHKTFGNGVVSEISNGKIVVNFSDGEKRFEYPSALQKGFLKKYNE